MYFKVFILDYKPYHVMFKYRHPTKKSDHIRLTSLTNILVEEHTSYGIIFFCISIASIDLQFYFYKEKQT